MLGWNGIFQVLFNITIMESKEVKKIRVLEEHVRGQAGLRSSGFFEGKKLDKMRSV